MTMTPGSIAQALHLGTRTQLAEAIGSDAKCYAWDYVEEALERIEEKLQGFFKHSEEGNRSATRTEPGPAS
jgi:hypothetical protein